MWPAVRWTFNYGTHIEKEMKRRAAAEVLAQGQLDAIKKAVIVAMFADDDLMDILVLKGGNAMDLVHQVNSRASVDLDFSMKDDLDPDAALGKIERALQSTLSLHGYHAFDIKMTVRPGQMPDDLASFWGGYLVEFKLISEKRAAEVNHDVDTMRREAILLGEGSKFTIDISRHEYVEDKERHDLDGYTIYVYSPEMIVCEKLRAICQQMPEYGLIVKRSQRDRGTQRARDFVDIEALVTMFGVDLASARAQETITQMFSAKRVPIDFLFSIQEARDFHAQGYEQVRATMKPGVRVHPFDHYFAFVLQEVKKLEPLRHE